MGYHEKKNINQFILQPDRTGSSTAAMMNNLSKGFSNYYNQLETSIELQLKSLRKTYLIYLSSVISGDTKNYHSTYEV